MKNKITSFIRLLPLMLPLMVAGQTSTAPFDVIIKGGTVYGSTDDFGFHAVENAVSVADLHATILHLLGMDYKKLFFEVDGKQERLTSNFDPRIVREILV